MALARDVMVTIKARADQDAEFRKALVSEAIERRLNEAGRRSWHTLQEPDTDVRPARQTRRRKACCVTTEANAFIWPGPDIRPVPGRTPTTMIYGRVPEPTMPARRCDVHRRFHTNCASPPSSDRNSAALIGSGRLGSSSLIRR